VSDQGQSALATEAKQRGLSYAFRLNFIVARKHKDWMPPYIHIDLNSGNGLNEEAGCIGSPLTFMGIFKSHPNFRAYFIDRDRDQALLLAARSQIKGDSRCSVHCADNADFLYELIESHNGTRKWQLGSILSDPNGSEVPMEAIVETVDFFPKIDVIFHWNSTITKRLKYGIKPGQMTLDMVPQLIPKQHWLVRKPRGPHQFTMLIGRNFRSDDWKSEGFYHLDSPEGEEIMDVCSRSKSERGN
jgi:three-Cys-motif partner protein